MSARTDARYASASRLVRNVVGALCQTRSTEYALPGTDRDSQLAHASPRAATHGDDHNSLWHCQVSVPA